MICKLEDTSAAEYLWNGWEETMIWSCMQKVMGEIYGDDPCKPKAVMAMLGDFCFFAGEPMQELVLFKPDWCQAECIIMVPQDHAWAELIEACYKEKAKKVSRYAMKKEPDIFNLDKLRESQASLPDGYEIAMIDKDIYYKCKQLDWCGDLISQFLDYESYKDLGLGVVILKNGVPVSGASSYTRYQGGIEIEIDTKENYRRQGFAYICGARLILECLDRNLYPSWDAQNKWSVALAEKLGYHYSHTYTAYEISGY